MIGRGLSAIRPGVGTGVGAGVRVDRESGVGVGVGVRTAPPGLRIRVSQKTFLLNFGPAEGRPCFTSVGCYGDENSSESEHI